MISLALAALTVGGGGVSLILCRLVKGGRFLAFVLLASYGLRVASATGFYIISAYHFPVLSDLQLGEGFWRFALDSPWYHWNAVRIAEAFRWGTEIPPLMMGGKPFGVDPDFYFAVAFVYRILVAHPLTVPLLNATLWSAISILVYILARRMQGDDAGQIAVLLVIFWPSSYVWSSQILKDSLIIFLLLSALFLCILIMEQRHRLWIAAIVPLVPAVFLLVRLRSYLLPLVVVAICGAVVFGLLRSSPHRQWERAVRGLVLMGILLTIFVLARSVDPAALLSPTRPELGHLRKARYLEEQGDHTAAGKEYQRASALNPGLTEAQLRVSKERQEPESGPPKLVVQKGIAQFFKTFSLERITVAREGFAGSGGASNVGEGVELQGFWPMVFFTPRGLAYALFAPFPWQRFSGSGDAGVFRLLAEIEVVAVFLIFPFLLVGVVRAARSGRPDAWLLLVFGVVTAILLGLGVTNIGILFRLRLQFLIPMLVILAAYGVSDRWRASFGHLASRFFGQPDRGAPLGRGGRGAGELLQGSSPLASHAGHRSSKLR